MTLLCQKTMLLVPGEHGRIELKVTGTGLAWKEACTGALSESEERKFLAQVGRAINALQMHLAECGDDPGSAEEWKAIVTFITEN